MGINLLLLLAAAPTPAANIGATANVNRVHMQARVQIVQMEKIGPVDRLAARKGYDRVMRRRGEIILVEFF